MWPLRVRSLHVLQSFRKFPPSGRGPPWLQGIPAWACGAQQTPCAKGCTLGSQGNWPLGGSTGSRFPCFMLHFLISSQSSGTFPCVILSFVLTVSPGAEKTFKRSVQNKFLGWLPNPCPGADPIPISRPHQPSCHPVLRSQLSYTQFLTPIQSPSSFS